ncbi:MAG: ATP synthase F1 subunit epsilon [Deltaproteobacteria bacterium]|jgi:F-type H+-transporting ATPase subunit epsilon|nr:ATP synthase F1 subunit epsilon [Deltaproteobacteria bacterium]
MHLVIVTPRGSKVDTNVSMVAVPGEMGELGILPGHRPLITALAIGVLTYSEGGKVKQLATNEGFMEVHDDELVVVTESAEEPDEIDAERAKKSLDAAEAALKTVDQYADPVGWKQLQEKRQRALNRLAVSRFATPEALRVQAQKSA